MSRFTMTLTAAAASAVAAIAAVALPAVGADSSKTPRTQAKTAADVAAFAACLRSHGLAGAPTGPAELKPWLGAREASDPDGVKAAMLACDDRRPDEKRAVMRGPDVKALAACLRTRGLDAPTAPDAFKRWFAAQDASSPDALKTAMGACKMALGPGAPDGPAKPGSCGDDVQPADKAANPDTEDAAQSGT